MNTKLILLSGAILVGLGIGLGAFGAHGLKDILERNGRVGTYETAALYHLIHGLALLAVGLIALQRPGESWAGPAWSFLVGTVVFSGSLYALAISNKGFLGAITPIGGLGFLLGWGWLAFLIVRRL